jgi:hypothetical protein
LIRRPATAMAAAPGRIRFTGVGIHHEACARITYASLPGRAPSQPCRGGRTTTLHGSVRIRSVLYLVLQVKIRAAVSPPIARRTSWLLSMRASREHPFLKAGAKRRSTIATPENEQPTASHPLRPSIGYWLSAIGYSFEPKARMSHLSLRRE